jgi:hypothetical protein
VISCTALFISEKPTLAQPNFLLVISMNTGGSLAFQTTANLETRIHKKIQVKVMLGVETLTSTAMH